MESPLSGYNLEPSKCRTLTINEKISLVRELSKSPETAHEKLQSWTRRDILEILCSDLGGDRKYTGFSKLRMLEQLFKAISVKAPSPSKTLLEDEQPVVKRQRKSETPTRLLAAATPLPAVAATSASPNSNSKTRFCENVACKAVLNASDLFCRRCSCCVCRNYDENKDPSLWLFCSSESNSQGDYSCGRSCHIECALKHEKSGILKDVNGKMIDGGYFCVYCGKENDLLGFWKKQLLIAKDARRVDVLCYRIYLSHKILNKTENYRAPHEIVDRAIKKLETDVGPITGLNMGRGIVNRLSVGAEVQRLCARAVETLESMISTLPPVAVQVQESGSIPPSFIRFPVVAPTCLTIVLKLEEITDLPPDLSGFKLWHQKVDVVDYPSEPTGMILLPNRSIQITELTPSTQYKLKLTAFGQGQSQSQTKDFVSWEVKEKTACFSKHSSKSCDLSNPSSEGSESNNSAAVYADLNKLPEPDFVDCENHKILGSPQVIARNGGTTEHEEDNMGLSASALDEEEPNINNIVMNNVNNLGLSKDSPNSVEHDPRSENASNAPNGNETGNINRLNEHHPDSTRPVTPGRVEKVPDGSGRLFLENGLVVRPEREPAGGSSSNKRVDSLHKEGCMEGSNYEYCVKVVRRLECEGLIESNFRVKFLTWFSLRATPQERRVVSVYVDTLIDDPVSLAGQLSDTFSERIYSKRPPLVPTGFCMELWH